ncbi:AbgT family transporter [Miniphocaeibacter massiliensis]|uniref:AbgT family transporter n=1 Tax=Miniphocaeibacter massiliensis TaxID=2041841 RepID=UPI000C1B8689|nr:AbgT family transporter [Miniphocaeibacter massiliensis]
MKKEKKDAQGSKFLRRIEKIGNAMPHPFMIFIIMSIAIMVISYFLQGTSVDFVNGRTGEKEVVEVVTLLNKDGINWMLNNMVDNFVSFAPLGVVLVAMLGVSISEWSGLIETALKKLLLGANPKILTPIIIFSGVMANVAGDVGYIVVIPLGALLFAEAGRNPIAGLAAAFAGVSAGFSANLLFGATDAQLSAITQTAADAVGLDVSITATSNWYFMAASAFMIVIIGTLITEKITVPTLGKYTGDFVVEKSEVTPLQSKGLRNAGIALLLIIIVIAICVIPENALFKTLDDNGDLSLKAFLSQGIIGIIFFVFLIPSIVYGITTKKIKTTKDMAEGFTEGMKSMGGFIFLAFFAAQFVKYFEYTHIATIISVKGAHFLESVGFTGIPLIIAFIILSSFLNLFLGSASAKWAIMAPIFIPMLFGVGLSPSLAQAAYRIGDSSTNIITPLMNYFAMIVVFAQKYDKKSGVGTIISTMLPYSFILLISWIILLIIFYVFNIPLGPGTFIQV